MFIFIRLLLIGILFLTGCSSVNTVSSSDNGSLLASWPGSHAQAANNPSPNGSAHHIVLLLPLQGNLASAGQSVKAGFIAANQGNSNVKVDTIDTSQYPSINAAYLAATQKGADFIVGPLSKPNVAQLQQQGNLPVPTLALNYSDETSALPSNLYEFGLSPLDEARQTADKAAQDNHHTALLIFQGSAWGRTVANALTSEWQQQNGTVVATAVLSDNDGDFNNQIKNLLQANGDNQTHRQDMDAIFLIASPSQARVIKPLLKFYYAGDIPVYATSLVYGGVTQPALNDDLNGIEFCDMPWLLNTDSASAQQRSQLIQSQSYSGTQLRLYAFGMDAYLLTQQLAKLGSTPSDGVSGATGQLYTTQQRIHRQLEWAQFDNGQVKPLT